MSQCPEASDKSDDPGCFLEKAGGRATPENWRRRMGHCVQAIVTTSDVADELQAIYPHIPRVTASQGFVILPVDAELVGWVEQIARPTRSHRLPWGLLERTPRKRHHDPKTISMTAKPISMMT
jgi:hypothetical protein